MSDPIRCQKPAFLQAMGGFTTFVLPALLIVEILFFGCAPPPATKPDSSTQSNTFKGVTPTGHPAAITFQHNDGTFTGTGVIGGKTVVFSGLTSLHGPAVVSYDDGTVVPAYITYSVNGEEITIRGLDSPLTIRKGGDQQIAASGPFAGSYRAAGPPQILLTLTQSGSLLAGTGFIDGKPVAVTGKTKESNYATGTMLFSDESRIGVKATLSEGGSVLSIQGLGAPIELKRK